MNLSFRKVLTIRMVLVLASTVAVVGLYVFTQATQAAEQLVTRVIRQTSGLIDERVTGLLVTAEGQSQLLASLSRERLPSPGGAIEEDLEQSRQLIEILRANEEFGSLSVVTSQGSRIRVDQLASGERIIQVRHRGTKAFVERTYRPFGNTFTQTQDEMMTSQDLSQTEALDRLKGTREAYWGSTSVFRNLQGVEFPAITLHTPIIRDDGEVIGMVELVYTLNDLSRYLSTVSVSRNGYAALLEVSGENNVRVIGYPQVDKLLTFEDGRQTLTTIEGLGDQVLAQVVREKKFGTATQTAVTEARVISEGRTYFAGLKRSSVTTGPRWITAVVVPTEDFLGPARGQVLFFVTFGLLALGVGIVTSLFLARRIAKPMQALAAEADRIQNLDFTGDPLPPSGIREINDLAGAMERMKVGLRSMEKLVPAEYARYLIASGREAKLGGQRRHITTYFADIVGFTRLSAQLPPEELMEVLTEYLDVLSGEVLTGGGTIDKFNGDDVMAFWGAPTVTTDHAYSACRTALRSQQALARLHTEWRENGRPLLYASFGIATGDVVVGNVGSRQRMNYTVLGDSVNLANRLQGFNKFYSTSILIGAQTANEAGDRLLVRQIDELSLLGREETLTVYELLALAEEATAEQRALADHYAKAFSSYQQRNWPDAILHLRACLSLAPHDGPSHILLKRVTEFQANPPAKDWAGVFAMTGK